MVDTSHTHGKRVTRVTEVTHPLDPLTESEIAAGRQILADAGHITATVRFPRCCPLSQTRRRLWRGSRARRLTAPFFL